MQHENTQMATRITLKEQELAYREAQNRRLQEAQGRLLIDLANRKMTLNELYTQLSALKKENARLETYNRSQENRKDELETKIQTYQREIISLEKNDIISDEEKKKRIAELKEQIRKYLKIITTM
jgi:hypothetical protein